MTRSISRRVRWLTCALATFAWVPVHGADEPRSDGSAVPLGLEFRIFDVSGLVAGRPDFRMESAPPRPIVEVGLTADGAIFGRESDERRPSFGTIGDVVAFVRSLDPGEFGDGGSNQLGALGDKRISLRGPPDLHRRVAQSLADLERPFLSVTTIDVVALRGEATSADGSDVATLLASGALVPLAGARSSGIGGRITARVGEERSYLAAAEVEVAESSRARDPIVRIARDGVAFEARLDFAASARVVVSLSAWWSKSGAVTSTGFPSSEDRIETVTSETRRFDGVVSLVPGAWKLLPTSGDVRFAVRATVRPHAPANPVMPPLSRCDPIADAGPVACRGHSVLALGARTFGLVPRPDVLHLSASGWKPEERDPRVEEGAFPSDALVETIRRNVDPAHWGQEGRALDLKNGHLYVEDDEAHDRAIVAFLDALRTQFLRTFDLRATVVSMPLSSLPEYWSGLGDGAVLLADGGHSLVARPGARVVDRGAVHVRSGQRDASVGGTQRLYLADYDIEVVQGASIGNPIVRAVLDGFACDLDVDQVAGGTAVRCTVRLHRGVWRGLRHVPTSHGDIECPTLGVSAIHGEIVIPLGSTRLVGADVDGEVVTLTWLEAREK